LIRTENLCKSYQRHEALKGLCLQVGRGELFAYLGPNGAGKTTTIRLLTGLSRPTAGNAYLNGFHVVRQSLRAKRQCGLVPQAINLDQELSVFENLDIHGRLFDIPRGERLENINRLLDYVGLQDRRATPIKMLSGGLKRRVMIARALVQNPRILFLDEPTVGLDAQIRRRIWALIKKIQRDGTTIFLTTHYIEEADFLADRVAFLDKGEMVAVDKPPVFKGRLGEWAIDVMKNDLVETVFFANRQEAEKFGANEKGSFTLRRVSLEDAYLALTGRKIS